jgi:hypothetical protein
MITVLYWIFTKCSLFFHWRFPDMNALRIRSRAQSAPSLPSSLSDQLFFLQRGKRFRSIYFAYWPCPKENGYHPRFRYIHQTFDLETGWMKYTSGYWCEWDRDQLEETDCAVARNLFSIASHLIGGYWFKFTKVSIDSHLTLTALFRCSWKRSIRSTDDTCDQTEHVHVCPRPQWHPPTLVNRLRMVT